MYKILLISLSVILLSGCAGTKPKQPKIPTDLMEQTKKEALLLEIIGTMDTTEMIKDFNTTTENIVTDIEAIRSKKDKSDKEINTYMNIYEKYYK